MDLRFGVLGIAVAGAWAAMAVIACGDGPPPPGYEQIGGGSGDGGAEEGTTTQTGMHSTNTSTMSTMSTMNTSTATSTVTSTSTSTGTGGLNCNQEASESNDTESDAADLGAESDCDGEASFSGVLEGVSDLDWFKYGGSDDFGCLVDPARTLTTSDPVRFCKYVQCMDDSAPDFSCPDGAQDATSPDGRKGCCGNSGFQIDFVCGSTGINDDSAWVYMSLKTTSNVCVTYSVDYHF